MKKSLYDELMASDWMERNAANFTHKRNATIGNATHGLGEAKSKYLINIKPNEKLDDIKSLYYARMLTRQVVKSMNTTGKPVQIFFTDKMVNKTDLTNIIVSTEPLSQKINFPSLNHRFDVIIGEGVHEMSHILYTKDTINEFAFGDSNPQIRHIKHGLTNILEDERIERLIGERFVGYADYLAAMKHYIFEYRMLFLQEAAKEQEATGNDLTDFIMTILHLVRYPKLLNRSSVDKYEDELREVIQILTPYPNTEEELVDAASDIFDIIKKFYKENEAHNKVTLVGENGEETEMDEQDFIEFLKILGALMKEIAKADTTQTTTNMTMRDGNNSLLLKMDEAEKEGAEQDLEDREQELPMEMDIHNDLQANTIITKLVDKGKDTNDFEYDRILAEVSGDAALLRGQIVKFNRNRSDTYRGLYEGEFDEDALVEAKLGAKNTYKQSAKIVNDGATILLGIDESGSMSGEVPLARKIAVIFERALAGTPNIDFYCYGHTTGSQWDVSDPIDQTDPTIIHAYYEGKKRGVRSCLANIDAYSGNRDGHAMLQMVNRVRMQTDKPIIFFLVSDGEPSASVPSGFSKTGYTKHCAEELEKYHNCQVIHIASDMSVRSDLMFTKYIKFRNMNELVTGIGALLKKTVTKFQQPRIILE
jgi:hypothetical protein